MANIIYYRNNANEEWQSIPALKGEDGKDGIDGATPVKGVDYFTEQEIEEIAEQAAAKVEIPDMAQYALAEHEHEEYLTEHQSLEGYATQEYVDEAVASIDVPEQDLSDYATTEYVDNAVNSIDVPDIDLTGYATEGYVDEAIDSIEIPNVPEVDLSGYAKKSDIPAIPTNVSSFTNDAGYLTKVPSAYVTESELDGKGYLTQHQSLANYATKTYVNDAVASVPRYDLTAYATKTYVDGAIDALPEYDMAAYALKSDVPDMGTYATKLYVQTEIAKAQVDEEEVDLTGYATEEWVNKQIDAIDIPEAVDLTGYAKTSYVNAALAEKSDVTHTHSAYALKSHTHDEYLTEHQDISGKADKTHKHVLADIEDYKEPDLSGYALKNHTHSEYLTEHQDLSAYALKSDIPTVPDVSAFQTEAQVQALIDASLGVIENGTY